MVKLSDHKMYETLVDLYCKHSPGEIVKCRRLYPWAVKLAHHGLLQELPFGCFKTIEEKRSEIENMINDFELSNNG